ncbi:MAG: hypothetical protein JNM18_16470 [Planctomycetaceae bacterium]|nr:hypothetical protein [Planctomycetaceae bacterium]
MQKHTPRNLRALLSLPTPQGLHGKDAGFYTIVNEQFGNSDFAEEGELTTVSRRRLHWNLIFDHTVFEELSKFTTLVTGRPLFEPLCIKWLRR